MAPVTHASQIQEDGFDDLCEAFRLYWDEDAFADLCEAFQFFGDEVEQDPIQAPLRALKSIAGAEEAKALFIIVKARFETAKRQGVDLSEEDFSVNIVGNRGKDISTIETLYEEFLESLDLQGQAYTPKDPPKNPHSCCFTIKMADYSDKELLSALARRIHKKFKKKMKVERGIVGLYSRIFVRKIARGRGKKNFKNEVDFEIAFSKVCQRQADRIYREISEGIKPDYFMLTKEDMIGPEPPDIYTRSSAWIELESMIGLENIKEQARALIDQAKLNYDRELKEKEPVQITLNRIIIGPAGTGKTTVAKLYGQILADLGLLSSREVVIQNPSDFIGEYLGESEQKTKKILEDARGKTLIIDHAYMLYFGSRSGGDDNSDVFRAAVIDTLVAEIENAPGDDRCVILIGYSEPMEEMFQNSNPGLARRFPPSDTFHFSNFDDTQLSKILDLKLISQGLQATSKAKDVALEVLARARNRPSFGNGAEVENLLSYAKAAYQKRVSKTAISEITDRIVFEPGDFDAEFDRAVRASNNCKLLFEDMVGCEDIIAQFQEYQQTVVGMRLHGIDPRPHIPFAFVFKGPPGTGKTTIARKVGQIFYDMAFLDSAHVVECSASDLVGKYVGHTGPKVIKVLESALGRVLFVDEAYRLGEGEFANEAVAEMVDCMTKIRFKQKIVIVLAGYKEDMDKLMTVNRGLRSRFATEVVFRPMRPEHCLVLLQQCVGKLGIRIEGVGELDNTTRTPIVKLFAKLVAFKSWANGRDVEKLAGIIIGHVFRTQASRNNVAKPLTVSPEELTTFLESMLEKNGGSRDGGLYHPPSYLNDTSVRRTWMT